MKFYVYEHWRLDRDECFYVGKGKGKRAYNMNDRNPHHRAIVAKLNRIGSSMEVRIVADGLDEDQAFSIEMERISFWRVSGADLTNRTDGGEGISNPHPEVREKISKALMGNKHSLGRIHTAEAKQRMSKAQTGRQPWLGKKATPEHRANLSKALKGRPGRLKTQEEKDKISATLKLRKISPETYAKISAGLKGHPVSEETRLKLSRAHKGRKKPQEQCAAQSKARKGVPWTESRRQAWLRSKESIGQSDGLR